MGRGYKRKNKKKEYLPGEELPTERELTELFGVSRMTIRQTITK
ncbi:GntR family transcriptional regulator [Clostridium estertheticum]|nr:GntR family transcriptional regulator [Clostridium estertheticum]